MRIGIDLGGTKIEGIVLAESGAEIARRRIPAPRGDYRATLDAILGLVEELAGSSSCDKNTPVGVGIPGAVSPSTGLIKNANSTWLIGRDLGGDLAGILNRPVRLANDANCFAVSEAVDGAGKGHSIVFGIILGTGVGGGIAIDGRAVSGPNAIAGEWGHNPLPWPQAGGGLSESPGPTCYCGKLGCIETFLSGPALSADVKAATGKTLSAQEIAAAASDGDDDASMAVERYTNRLARALAATINVLDPDIIVFGGGVSALSTIYADLPALLKTFVFGGDCDTPCVKNMHGDSSGVRGAAWLWPPNAISAESAASAPSASE